MRSRRSRRTCGGRTDGKGPRRGGSRPPLRRIRDRSVRSRATVVHVQLRRVRTLGRRSVLSGTRSFAPAPGDRITRRTAESFAPFSARSMLSRILRLSPDRRPALPPRCSSGGGGATGSPSSGGSGSAGSGSAGSGSGTGCEGGGCCGGGATGSRRGVGVGRGGGSVPPIGGGRRCRSWDPCSRSRGAGGPGLRPGGGGPPAPASRSPWLLQVARPHGVGVVVLVAVRPSSSSENTVSNAIAGYALPG